MSGWLWLILIVVVVLASTGGFLPVRTQRCSGGSDSISDDSGRDERGTSLLAHAPELVKRPIVTNRVVTGSGTVDDLEFAAGPSATVSGRPVSTQAWNVSAGHVLGGVLRGSLLSALWLVLICLMVTACTSSTHRDDSRPEPTRGPTVNSFAARQIGEQLTLTAGVEKMLETHAFVVQDVNLPVRGLLVLGDPPRELRAPDLVTVRGIVERFEFQRFAEPYALRDKALYTPFEGQKMIIADMIKSLG